MAAATPVGLASPALVATATAMAEAVRAPGQDCDRDDTFPLEGLAALRESGLMGLMVPARYGGLGGTATDLSRCSRIIAGGDLSTAMVWSMHCQQVAVIADHAPESLRQRLLPRIAAGEVYVASATTEAGKGGHLMSAVAALQSDGPTVGVSRTSPVVTGGAYADGYLMTLRRSVDGPTSDVVLVYADRDQLTIDQRGTWEMLGMRATQSASVQIDGTVPGDQVIDPPDGFGMVATGSMVPFGHIAWASSWLGAAEEALRSYVGLLRSPGKGPKAASLGEVGLHRLARVRLRLDCADAYVAQVVRHYDELRATHGPEAPIFAEPGVGIEINSLKVVVSEEAFAAVDELMTLAGLAFGYGRSSPIGLERAFRDLRSAALMYANDRLLSANGRLCLMDRDLRRPATLLNGGAPAVEPEAWEPA
jgi:acyl-CoA dehydrogenase